MTDSEEILDELETPQTTAVITHRGRLGCVELCQRHSDDALLVRLHVGAEYYGVQHGLHAGQCLVCEEVSSLEPQHGADEDCTLDYWGVCVRCDRRHDVDPCDVCGGRAYHRDGCSEVGA